MRVLMARKRITAERIAQLSPREQSGLLLLGRTREYAIELGLAPSSSYRHLIERSEGLGVRVLVAAHPDRLEAVTWWFPFVGRVSYRGYFDAEPLRLFQEKLEAQGLDTYTRDALLYSTLGWFDDPIPRELLEYTPSQIVETILHELVHETVFVRGDTAYNEALATLVGQRGTLEHFADDPAELDAARRRYADARLFAKLLRDLSRELSELYAGAASPDEALRARSAVFERFQREVHPALPWNTESYSGFRTAQLSNAYVLANQAYLEDLPCLESELRALDGDLRAFIQAHRERPGRRQPAASCSPGAS